MSSRRSAITSKPRRSVETKYVRLPSVQPGDYDVVDKIRELSLNGTAVAKRVGVDRGDELGVQTSIG
jgi:hypothetical protein